jgi:bifunctional non-homologous end joining protein LigD
MAARANPLAKYNAKRDFAKTAEPSGELGRGEGNSFMVQKHDASRLHFDFRLELEGVLKSWAVTKGPSLNPDDKRLAVRTEDHPLSYATFEGTIPKGQYGGGTVMLWDRGTWESIPGKDPRKTIEEGHLHFILHGDRMKGEWLLVRMKPRPGEKSENWLLRKVEDAYAGGSGDLVDKEITSVASGRTMAEIEAGKNGKSVWRSDRAADDQPDVKPAPPPSSSPRKLGSNVDSRVRGNDKKRHALPAFQPLQLATLVDQVPPGSGWLHEVKYDGYRLLMAVAGKKAKAYTRTGQDWSDRFKPIVDAFAKLDLPPCLIDGEAVALDSKGHPSFQTLQATLKGGNAPLAFFAFDVLEIDGEDVTGVGNSERKDRLAELVADARPPIHFADHIESNGEGLFKSLCREGFEGIVSKRADAPYRGRRTQSWLKIKCTKRQEFVIVGWTPSDKQRGFRALLLGVNEGDQLRYSGKVGTGFDGATMDMLMRKLKPLEQKTPTVEAPRAAVSGAHWVTPQLVAEIAFAEVTGEGLLRHPSFLGLREDKPAKEVVEERPRKMTDDAPFGIKISNPDRIIFPDSGITKGELAAYYAAIADPMLKWAADRPVSLVRCPQGRGKHCFFQKHEGGTFGDHVKGTPIKEKDGHAESYIYVDSPEGLLACVQMGTIEFHGWGSKVGAVENPDRMVFDLDPDEGLGFEQVKDAAKLLRRTLEEMGLVTFPLLSGGKGVHLVVPLDASAEWPAVKDFANRLSRAIADAHPDIFTANMKKVERKGRIFLDWLRNQRGATAVLPYSARARPNAPVAAPISWEELDDTASPVRFTIRDTDELLKRAKSRALKGWGQKDQALPDL